MAKYTTLSGLFTAIATSLRGKTGSTGKIVADDFPSVIDGLSTGGITPSGTKAITSNGSYDVTNFATAQVDVPTGGGSNNYHVLPITISSDLGAGTNAMHNLVTGDSFVKTNYANDNFFAILFPVTPTEQTTESNYVTFVYAGNRVIVRSKSIGYAIFAKGAGSSSYANGQINNYKISQSGYNVTLRANSSGNIILYVASSLTVPAGDYLLVYALAE